MGLTAIVSAGAAGASSAGAAGTSAATSLMSPVGLSVGGVFVAAALVLSLAYYDMLGTIDIDAESGSVRSNVLAVITPLAATFTAVLLFQTLQVL